MAHQTVDRTAIDEAAATAAAAIEPTAQPEQETTLAYGAEGGCLTKLVELLALLGYSTNDVLTGTSHTLDESVLVDLRAARSELAIGEANGNDLVTPDAIPIGVKGELVTSAVWDALYAAAVRDLAAKSEPETAQE